MSVSVIIAVTVLVLCMGITLGKFAEANKWRSAARKGFLKESGGELYEVCTAEQRNSKNVTEMMYIGS